MTGAQPVAAILAGGDGVRLGRGIKPLAALAGRALLHHVVARLTPQTGTIALSLRRDAPWTAAFGLPVIADAMPTDAMPADVMPADAMSNAGPAGGLLGALLWAKGMGETVLTGPADCPFLPHDLAARLTQALDDNADIAVAASGGRRHHLIALWRTRLADAVSDILRREGAIAIHRLQRHFRIREVVWPTVPHDPFFNINTPGDLTEAERICSSHQS